jgi:hypothetical protein
MEKWSIATIYFCIVWFIFLGACFSAWQRGIYSPIEARAKLVFTGLLSISIYGFCVHWSVGVVLFVAAFVSYFRVKRRLMERTRDRSLLIDRTAPH